jgi:hypothetical protein
VVYRHARHRGDRTTPHPTKERLVDIAEVLSRADETTGALYHHFRDVPHLLEEAMARRFPAGVRES